MSSHSAAGHESVIFGAFASDAHQILTLYLLAGKFPVYAAPTAWVKG